MQATPRNRIVGGLADILKSGKSAMDQYEMKPWVPLVGGLGLGEMFMGKAPELVDDISYDGLQAAIRGGNSATGGIGTYSARPAVFDATLLGLDALGVGKGMGALTKASGRAAGNALMGGTTELGRREFMKKVAALSASAATAGGGVGMLRKLGKETGEAVANTIPKVSDNIASNITKHKFNSLDDYIKDVAMRTEDELGVAGREIGGFTDREYEDFVKRGFDKQFASNLEQDASIYNIHKSNAKAYGNPDRQLNSLQTKLRDNANKYLEDTSFSPQAKQEMRDWKADQNGFWNTSKEEYPFSPDEIEVGW